MEINSVQRMKACLGTLGAKRSELWLARIFGKKVVTIDSGWKTTIRYWRGKSYLVDFKKI